jgi:hypothetical protein
MGVYKPPIAAEISWKEKKLLTNIKEIVSEKIRN